MRYENSIEADFREQLLKWARENEVNLKILKLNVQGTRGWPDRLIIWSGGHTLYVEFKRPGQEPRKLQVKIHNELKEMGFDVRIFDDTKEALEYVKAKIRTTRITDQGNDAGGEGGRVPPVSETGQG